jgi:hypothetical protein
LDDRTKKTTQKLLDAVNERDEDVGLVFHPERETAIIQQPWPTITATILTPLYFQGYEEVGSALVIERGEKTKVTCFTNRGRVRADVVIGD